MILVDNIQKFIRYKILKYLFPTFWLQKWPIIVVGAMPKNIITALGWSPVNHLTGNSSSSRYETIIFLLPRFSRHYFTQDLMAKTVLVV